jgi:asparagine synthase (glutamine-hydrolysing)
MVSDNGRYVIVFNGEIYNYADIRNQVSGIQNLRSTSDTEVILKLFALEGPECLNKLRGMFAFAIWDDKEKKLFAARDRFGIKPFYYLNNKSEFIFSSELKAIKHYKNGLTLSMQGMDAFLKTGSVPAPLTIYEETKALLPGHWLECKMSDGRWKMEIKQYWSFFDLISHPEPVSGSDLSLRGAKRQPAPLWRGSNLPYDDNAKQLIRNSLLDSTKVHMVSDVEVGAFLSGGIDSTSIVSLMRQIGHEKIKTISVTFPGFIHDEAEYSNIAAQEFETDHHEYRLQEHEIIDELDKIIEGMDQPTIDGINTYFVSKAAKEFGLKVVLSGLGGDELFGGYPSFYNIPKYQRINRLPFAKLAMKAAIPFVKNRLPAKALRYMKEPDRINAEYILVRGLFTDDELSDLGWKNSFPHPFCHPELVEGSPSVIANPPWREKQSLNPLQHVSFLESTFYMRNQLLRDSDVFGMAHSIELRVPFVDHHLYGTVLPYLHSSYDRNESKRMLVDAVGDLPNEISNRMKMGFTFPFDVWMRSGKLHNVIKDTLLHKDKFDFIPLAGRKLLLDKFERRKIHWSRVWALQILANFK